MITLTKREQLLGLRLLENSISRDEQEEYKSHAFYSTICKLKRLGLIRSKKRGRTCEYVLTDDGFILFSLIACFEGNEEYREFAIKGTRLINFD